MTTTYEFQTVSGDLLNKVDNFQSDFMEIDQMAIVEAKMRLEEDPELGEVLVFKDGCYIGKATHVPDHDWQSVVAWLWDGEQVLPPAGAVIPAYFACDPDESCGYDLSDPKSEGFHDRMAEVWDSREGK